jgi:hypothetical protein
MCLSPRFDIGIDFAVGAFVLRHQPAPCSDRAAEAAGEVSAFADLAFRRADLVERVVLAQHLAGDHAVWLQLLVAGAVEFAIGRKLPCLAREACQDARLDV